MEKAKTIFVDIDGVILKHFDQGLSKQMNNLSYTAFDESTMVADAIKKFDEWDVKGYNIILTTGRRESHRKKTEEILTSLGLYYDQLIMGLGGGDRIIINDKKLNSDRNTAYAINIKRNDGLKDVDV